MTPHPYLSRDYIALQLTFAERIAQATGQPLPETLLYFTNIHRRLGLGKPAKGAVPAALWQDLVAGIETLPHEARLARLMDALSGQADGTIALLPGRMGFGCFACEPPDPAGMVRIHFGNREQRTDVGPLHHTRIEARRAELHAMFGWLTRAHPEATHVNGGSWLYNLEAYRRLFPPAFGASRDPGDGPESLSGMSSWGQFINHRGEIRPDVRDAFVANLATLDVDAPHRTFPYQVLFTTAPFDAFRREYGV